MSAARSVAASGSQTWVTMRSRESGGQIVESVTQVADEAEQVADVDARTDAVGDEGEEGRASDEKVSAASATSRPTSWARRRTAGVSALVEVAQWVDEGVTKTAPAIRGWCPATRSPTGSARSPGFGCGRADLEANGLSAGGLVSDQPAYAVGTAWWWRSGW